MPSRYTNDEAVRASRKITLASSIPAAGDFAAANMAQVHGEWGWGIGVGGEVYLMALLATAAGTLSQNYTLITTQI